MVIDLRDSLTARGVDSHHVHTELFHVDDATPRTGVPAEGGTEVPAAAGEGAEVTIMLDGRQSTFRLDAADDHDHEAALRGPPDAPFACKSGVCGTCRAKVVEGRSRWTRTTRSSPTRSTRLRPHLPVHPTTRAAASLDYDA